VTGVDTATEDQQRIVSWLDDLRSCVETETVLLHLPDTGPARIEAIGHAIDGYTITVMLTCGWDNRLVSVHTDGVCRTHCSISIDPDRIDAQAWKSWPAFLNAI
jgi:hypothetical protein